MQIPRRPSIVALPVLSFVAALAWPDEARAESPHWVSPGLSFGVTFGDRTSFSLGLDVRYTYLLEGASTCGNGATFGLGAFGQASLIINSGGAAGRFALGAQGGGGPASFVFQPSAEVGWTYRTAYRETATQPRSPGWHGLHVGLHSWFILAEELSVRGAIPLFAPPHALPEMTIAIGGRFPPPQGIQGFCIEGRPLRRGDELILPPLLRASPRRAQDPALLGVADAWLESARAECASIPVFAALARDLAAVAAPAALVERALVAADDEARHTLLCSAVAARLSGTLAAPLLLAPPPFSDKSREEALARLAIESWRDGCVGEGAAAERARRALADTEDPFARAALLQIAADEQRHADLAWDVLRFCVAEGGRAVAEVVAAQIAAETRDQPSGGEGPRDLGAWRAHGRLDEAATAAANDDQRALARREGNRLLAQFGG